MQLNTNVEALEICGLEYDVASVGAGESMTSEVNYPAKCQVFFYYFGFAI